MQNTQKIKQTTKQSKAKESKGNKREKINQQSGPTEKKKGTRKLSQKQTFFYAYKKDK